MRFLLSFLALVLALPTAHAQQTRVVRGDSVFAWRERIPTGSWLRIYNVQGPIEVRESTSGFAEVRAERLAGTRRRAEDDLTFEVHKDGSNVTICAVWRSSTCDEDGVDSDDDGDRQGKVSFIVGLPKGVRMQAGTGNGEVSVQNAGADVSATSGNGRVRVASAAGQVYASSGNGDIDVDDARGKVQARTGNGDVHVTTAAGPVSAMSGNGRIDVRMASLHGDDTMDFRTGNGSVIVTVPADFAAEVDARSGHGTLHSAFPMLVEGRLDPQHVRGTIGKGGRRVRLSSGNGNLEIRRIEN
jgi:DUF4097 and DUF4098 domain-containing protein YvlB